MEKGETQGQEERRGKGVMSSIYSPEFRVSLPGRASKVLWVFLKALLSKAFKNTHNMSRT
jgi:hypothetical protein